MNQSVNELCEARANDFVLIDRYDISQTKADILPNINYDFMFASLTEWLHIMGTQCHMKKRLVEGTVLGRRSKFGVARKRRRWNDARKNNCFSTHGFEKRR